MKIVSSILPKIENIAAGGISKAKAATNVFKMKSRPICDTFRGVCELAFDDLYNVKKLGNGRIRFVPKVPQANGKTITPFEMPEYLYHITSEANLRLIQSSKKLMRSMDEQLPGVYMVDKENFLARYQSVGDKKRDLCKSLLLHAYKKTPDSPNITIIKIPTENLLRNGKMRIRTQEDFLYYQDKVKELQKGLQKKYRLRELQDDSIRAQFEKHVLDNKLMTEGELRQFMDEMRKKIHLGYSVSKLTNLEKNRAVEFIYNQDICLDDIKGIRFNPFSLEDCMDAKTGIVNIEKLRSFFDW